MNDIFNKTILLGARIAFNPPTYKGLVIGEVVGFTPKMVKVKYNPSGKQNSRDGITHVLPQDVVIE